MLVVQKSSNAWKWVLGILVGLVLLCGGGIVACSVLVAGGVKNEQDKQTAADTKSCEGESYPDQQPSNDHCADAANTVVLEDVSVTATPLQRTDGNLCTDVSYTNNSNETISFNEFDWKLQLPTGEVQDAFDTTLDSSLGAGDLVKGGHKTGTVCYQSTTKGQHVLIYKPSIWSDARGIWVNVVS